MKRRKFITNTIGLPAVMLAPPYILFGNETLSIKPTKFQRVRPGEVGWPSAEAWERLNKAIDGKLIPLNSPFKECNLKGSDCSEVFQKLKNPYAIGDDPTLTQTLGWQNAWESEASVYAVAASSTRDVVAAVKFARANKLRLVIKGGGHSYQGTSNSKDSLLIWTRAINEVVINESFQAKNCEKISGPVPAVTVGAGAIWMHVYDTVTTQAGWYVQGGGCATVGVAGLIQSGGFGSLSKSFGLAASGLLEAEVVTADGNVLVANECTNADLFWALKGGGGGSLGVVTSVTLKLRKLPEHVGVVFGSIKASSESAFNKLIQFIVAFYKANLFNSHWGEQLRFSPDNVLSISMMFQGVSENEAKHIWRNVELYVVENSTLFTWLRPIGVHELPAQDLWNPKFFDRIAPELIVKDNRTGAPEKNIFWIGDMEEAGQFLHGYRSLWLSQKLLNTGNQLGNAIFSACRYWTVSLHFNKGLAGSPEAERVAAKNTAMNPIVLDAFALAIIAGGSQPAMPGIEGHEPDEQQGNANAKQIDLAMIELQKIEPSRGSYVSESNFFETNWQQSFWGNNYQRLAQVKKRYDPDGLFFVHHGVGSEAWSADGFSRL